MQNNKKHKYTYLSEREMVMMRVFNCPRTLVFDAITKPEILKKWYGPKTWTLDICEIDLQKDGKWRYEIINPDGKRLGVHGEIRELDPPRKLVRTETYEDFIEGELLVTMELEDIEGQTQLTMTVLNPSREIRDANTPLEQGAAESFDRLGKYLNSLD